MPGYYGVSQQSHIYNSNIWNVPVSSKGILYHYKYSRCFQKSHLPSEVAINYFSYTLSCKMLCVCKINPGNITNTHLIKFKLARLEIKNTIKNSWMYLTNSH